MRPRVGGTRGRRSWGLLPVAKALALPEGRHRLPTKTRPGGNFREGLHDRSACRTRSPASEITYALAALISLEQSRQRCAASLAGEPAGLCVGRRFLPQARGLRMEARGIYRVRRIGGLGSDARVTDTTTVMDVPELGLPRAGLPASISTRCLGRTNTMPRSPARSGDAVKTGSQGSWS